MVMGASLRGHLEWASRFGVAGWARDQDGQAPLRLEVLAGRRRLGVAVADRYRPDLAAAGEGDGRCAFELWFNPPLPPSGAPALSVQSAAGTPLPGSPFALAPDPPMAAPPPALDGPADVALVVDEAAPDAARDAGSAAVLSHMAALGALGLEVQFAPRAAAAEAARRLGRRVCVAYLHRLRTMLDCHGAIRAACPGARVLFAIADLASLRVARQVRVLGGEQPHGLLAAEAAALAAADAVLTHSDVEAALLARMADQGAGRLPPTVHVVPWAVPPRPQAADWAARAGVGFVGNFGHAPNLDAAMGLLEAVMPLVWRQAPVPCVLAGYGPPAWLCARAGGLVEVIGSLDDIAALWRRVRVSAAPLRFGAGVKGKVLDSLAAGVPAVCSPVAAEGIALPPPLLAADPAAMAATLLRLHEDQAANAALAAAGLAMIGDRHGAATVTRALGAAVAAALAR
jgi:hypothetical protein